MTVERDPRQNKTQITRAQKKDSQNTEIAAKVLKRDRTETVKEVEKENARRRQDAVRV